MPTVLVRPPRRVPRVADLAALGRAHGLDAVGVAPAGPFATTRRHLERRGAAGLHGGMAFTYRRPERSTDPAHALPGARSIVVGARSYRRAAAVAQPGREGRPHTAPGSPLRARPLGRVARYAWEDHYAPLRSALTLVARELEGMGWRCRVVADDNALVDREAAYRAGVGWYGKNANLLLPGRGSWFVLGSVITDAPLAAPEERTADACGSCTRCIEGCPTGAIVAPGVVDARRCLAWLLQIEGPFPREYRAALGDRLYGCDDCQEVCPPNHRADRIDPASGAAPGAEPVVDLLDMLAAGDDELMARHGRWYVPRRQARYLRRNALVVLGNVADPQDPAVAASLCRALADGDPLVRGHAVWAARRLGRPDLLGAVPGVAEDRDPLVRAELEAAVDARVPGPGAAAVPVPAPTG
ncbi:MAG TPA: tRNA epoxyqueuosine(34) reductase QueG [Acidimicrobiales bacterium]|nr:tRNA epoxyqueuosine(34) reductase QueG [Acidimicrobiales bacterium]